MQVALGVGSLVLLAGGSTAMVRRSMGPGQAISVLAIAVVVAVVALLADWLTRSRGLGSFYGPAVIVTTTLAGIVMAVAAVARPHSRRTPPGP